jgi:hypothetical protein
MIKSRKRRWAGMLHEWGRRGMYIEYWWESQRERDNKGDECVGGWVL